ncbi:hypothetical protein OEA41_009570 [Lepraria neglecta]|uniref:Uncharacterized protein n=1 Tax=Lepraria neglecta TaxID=209136 RepID=A0AAE0DHW1_9LECA|nr:hypothetical protein OEA41_009570 [Lepraria neglecta]
MPTTLSRRPQTLKQAKKAYRKSGATVRLSESELAVIERRAVLQERADRIKEREARRKANLKRRDEKIQREMEARQRMGIQSPVKGAIHVGPSQLHLGDFMAMGVKRKTEDTPPRDTKVERESILDMELNGCQKLISAPLSLRKPVSANTKAKLEPLAKTEGSKIPAEKYKGSQNRRPMPTAPSRSLHTRPTTSTSQQKPPAKPEDPTITIEEEKMLDEFRVMPMGSPPLPNSTRAKATYITAQQKPPVFASQGKPPDTVHDCWDDFFVSNTQIVRELSPPITKFIPTTLPTIQPPSNPPTTLPKPSNDDASALLNFLSTEDLDISDILTQATPPPPEEEEEEDTSTLLAQISTQDLDFSEQLTQARTGSSDFDDGLTEEDLEDLALEVEMELQSTQESNESQCREAQLAAEEDGFELSTQDLQELES